MKDILKVLVYGGLFLVPFLTLYVANDLFFPFITGKNFIFRIIVEIAFAAWAVLALLDKAYRPKFSWLLASFSALLVIMFVANILGEYPYKSFWSNFERMDGYVTLAHIYLYFVVLGSTLITKKSWSMYLHTTLIVAFIVALYGLAQYSGAVEGYRGRIDSRLGNAAYMAIYMFFHIFVIFYLFLQTKTNIHRVFYGIFAFTFIFTLIQTGTRGTAIGLLVGAIVMVGYVGLFGKKFQQFRKYSLGAFIVFLIAIGGFVAARDTEFVQDNRNLSRIANISIDDLTVRGTIWSMAIEGVKERPILGWGQGNFNYVFNEQYNPALYGEEQWFDRVHNIFFDWLIAGGILGFLAYFSILGAIIYYLFWRPLFKDDQTFTVLERGVLLGLIAGYFTHNLVVFDNIVSYIFYGMILALIHSRVGIEIPKVQNWKISKNVVEQVVAPVVGIALLATVYYVNIPGLQAAGDIIDAFSSRSPETMLVEFDEALSRGSFGNQEIREQMTRQVQNLIQSPQVSDELKQEAFKKVEAELLKQAEEKPGDARVHVFISSFYRMTNNIDQAIVQLEIARSLSPNKQQIISEQGLVHMQKSDFESAFEFFKVGYELDTSNPDARIYYSIAALYTGQPELVDELINDEKVMDRFARNDLSIQAAYQAKEFDLLKRIFASRIARTPDDSQLRVNLAVIHHESGDTEGAIEILETAAVDIPAFTEQASGFIEDLRAGRNPGQPAVSVEGEEMEVHPQ